MTAPRPRPLIVHKELDFGAPLDQVWLAITRADRIVRWFCDEMQGDAFGPGSTGTFTWKEHGSCGYHVESMNPPHHLVWRWARDPDAPLGEGWTRVDWKLAKLPSGGTRLTLVESGFRDEKALDENNGGWDHELGELRDQLAG